MKDSKEWSDSILIWVLAISIAIILFSGEPDIGDALRHKAIAWAGLDEGEQP